jgi:LPS-assembly protein
MVVSTITTKRHPGLIGLAVAIALSATPLQAATQPNSETPPLGILIAPADSVLQPPLQLKENAPTPRPLGILLGPGSAQQPDAKITPFNPTIVPSPSFAPAPRPILQSPAPQSSTQRPLGVLLQPPPKYDPPIIEPDPLPISQEYSVSAQPQKIAKPNLIVPVSPDASLQRPLGTLFKTTDSPNAPSSAQPTSVFNSPSTQLPNPSPSTSKASQSAAPAVHFLADEMSFDREQGIVTAIGNVEVRYGQRVLVADRIEYDQNKDTASAIGNVALREPTGERMFGDKMDVSGDLKDAVVINIGMILKDRSRIAGTNATRSGGTVTKLRNAIYSPCNLCAKDPNAPPLWQIKAVKVVHNKNEQIVEYRDAWLEFFGFPVAYTPYFRHPDPTVKRKSGFLFPRFGSSSDFGTIVEAPYFWAISDHEDMTARPIVMTDEAPVLSLQYRNRMRTGEVNVDTSITDNSEDQFTTEEGEFGIRGHIIADARFDLNRTWRWGLDVERATDDTYLRRYGFASPPSLDSQFFVEGFRKQSYFSAKTLLFQGLQETDDQDATPVVLPLVDYNYVGKLDRIGGRTKFDFNFLALTRKQGTDTRRMSFQPEWERAFQGPFGDLYRFETGINADFYHVNSLSRGSSKEEFSGLSHRLFPYASLNWRLPLVKSQGSVRQILEPIASVAIAPNGGNSDKIPNEDSTDFEFDETNLFSFNRFSGIDRVEGGSRINYGLKWGLFGEGGGSTTMFFGQTYRLRADSTFGAGSGLEDNLSDIVGSISVSPGSYLDVLYRTRFSTDNLSPNRNEMSFKAGVPAFNVNGSYSFLDQQEDSEFSGREEMNLSASTVINRFWRGNVHAVRDMQSSEMRSLSLDAIYENECVVFTSRLTRTFFEDRDLKPTDAITFHLVLKTIGEVRSGASISSN